MAKGRCGKVPPENMSPTKTKRPSKSKSKSGPRSKAPKFKGKGGGRPKPVRTAHRKMAGVEPIRPAENPRAKGLAKRIADLCLEKKGLDVVILDVRGMTSYADYFVVASGESERQVSAMAQNVVTQLKTEGFTTFGSEGFETGRWVLVDFGEVVAHLFFEEVRSFYDLEGLWADAPREKVA
jgi:ribosome-associated protein